MSAYGEAAIERECAEVATTGAGRNDRLNRAAFALGQLVGAGALERSAAESRLFAAAQACGYVATDGACASRSTIRSGLDKGELAPRTVPAIGDRKPGAATATQPRPKTVCLPDDDTKRRAALAVWREADDPRGTIVERYLASRALELQDDIAGAVLRFHPRCPWKEGEPSRTIFVPAMIALFRDVHTDEPVAIHRTRLTPDGDKIGRKMLGGTRGAAIKLDDDADVTMGLTIGEGGETCLAGRQLGFRPVWALGSAGAIAAFPVLPGIEALTILAERCPVNARAIQACGERWKATGHEVIVVQPRHGKDINDALRGAA